MPDSQTLSLPNEAYLLPQAIPMWPPVWWVWVIVGIIILGLTGTLLYFLRRHKKRAYRHEAIATINRAMKNNSPNQLSDKDCIVLCHEMIRRCLISERKVEMASLPSKALIETLDQSMPQKRQLSSLGDAFFDGPYQPSIELTLQQRNTMLNAVIYWIRKHHA